MILQNWKSIMEILGICQKKEITKSKSIGVPLSMVWPPPFQPLKVARDIIVTLKRLHKSKILYHNISINNIMCTLKKGKLIVLESGKSITAKSLILLADGKDSRLEVSWMITIC